MTDALCHLVVDGNDVLEIKLVRSQKDIEDEDTSFGPEMCHQVFGENENIFGYQDLQIHLYYSAGSLLTYLGIEYTDKIEPSKSEGLTADDVEGALQKVLAPGYITNLDRFISMLDKDAHFTPHGRLVHSFTVTPDECGTKRTFEVYYNETSTPGFLQYHERLQTFLLWYVDAASFIDVDDDQWTFFTVFEKWQSSEGDWRYASAAYATAYRYYAYPKHTRPRVSQVLTLPPFRKMGICAHLLQAIYSHFTIQPDVIDITVEDPSQDFQRIRDYVDARNCAELPAFQPEKLANGFTTEMWQSARSQLKINKRQARRVYEILRLRATDMSDATAYRAYRLHVKNRLNAPHQVGTHCTDTADAAAYRAYRLHVKNRLNAPHQVGTYCTAPGRRLLHRTSFTTEMWQSARAQLKINKRQARRVYEILRLRATDMSDATAYRAYRLHVKNRLNAPHQKRKLEMKKLQKVLKPEEYAATISVAGASETHDRLKSQYLALEQEYRRVLDRWDRD